MTKLKIAIVDSGVNIENSFIKDDTINGFSFNKDFSLNRDIKDDFGHGTAVYGIIRSVSHMADIINIKISGIEDGVEESVLIKVLEYLYENVRPDIINLSLGITICEDYTSLYNICHKLNESGTIIVSAFDNSGSYSFPAAFDCVVGVISRPECRKNNDFIYFDDTIVNIAANGNVQRILWNEPEFVFLGGNSFACAHVTCIISRIISEQRDAWVCKLKEKALSVHTFTQPDHPMPLFYISKAAIFPFAKEMHSLIRYKDLLNFEIIDIYDIRQSAKVNASTNVLLGETLPYHYYIKDINHIEWNKIDTLIIGHLDELEVITKNINMLQKLVYEAQKHHVNIVSFDHIEPNITKNCMIYYPQVDNSIVEPNRLGMLYRISKPVIAIMGTSSKQGKFTLQLKLRQKFLKDKVNIGQIGTEPTALLFNMDYVYPMGYGNSVNLENNDAIIYLNKLMHNLCIENKEIIIVGSQSGTIPYDTGNLQQYPLRQMLFMLGIQPDAVVLCINPYDEVDYIKRTISFIEALNATVIALVVFPFTLKNPNTGIYGGKRLIAEKEYESLKAFLEMETQKNIYKLNIESDMELLYKQICEFFKP